jgi:AcrR family transcriptional regulator
MAYRRSPLMQERLADNRERILGAARTLIARGGFRAASIAAVAQEVGLSTGAIYRYFPSKAGLFVELLSAAVDHEVAILRRVIGEPGPAAARLRAAVESFAARALKGPHLAYAFIVEPTDPEVEAARILCRRQFGAVFEDILRQGVRRGEFPVQRIEITAACIVGAFTEALVRPVAPHSPIVHKARGQALVNGIADACLRAAGHALPRPAERPAQRPGARQRASATSSRKPAQAASVAASSAGRRGRNNT